MPLVSLYTPWKRQKTYGVEGLAEWNGSMKTTQLEF